VTNNGGISDKNCYPSVKNFNGIIKSASVGVFGEVVRLLNYGFFENWGEIA
jgi:hypothetical protein